MNAPVIKTTCPYCGVGCGIEATVIDAERHLVHIAGDASHPSNFGRLCSKGSALGDTVGLENRLLHPEINGRCVDWDTALAHVAERFGAIIEQHGPDAVAFYVSGQLLTEDYYVANKLMKGFIGSANIDTNSRLCMSSAVVGYKRAFGADAVPCTYQDLEQAELIVLAGSNAAWCHPVIFQRIRRAKENNPALKIVVIDPRNTPSCDIADLHLPIKPGMDAVLFNGLLTYLADHDGLDAAFIAGHTEGFAEALATARQYTGSIEQVAADCGLQPAEVETLFRWFAATERAITLYSQGINQSSSGSDKCNAIINCHLASGKIGKPGAGPFSFTGQPNAMGGREVGGLANMLAAHMELDNPEHADRVARFWGSDRVASRQGLKAVALFDAIAAGQVKAIWIMATNPVVSMPDADHVKQALQQCELVVVSDCIANTDTVELAHVKFPATGWSEKDGTVTNLERRISRQRRLFAPSGEAQPDWWIISEIARRMGFGPAFAYRSNAEIFREHAALSAFENDSEHGRRDFDISAFADIDQARFDALPSVQWPVNAQNPGGTARLFTDSRFYTASGKAKFIAIAPRPPQHAPTADYPFTLNTGRLRDQWHTMTRTALAVKLNVHRPEPLVEIHPQDASRLNLQAKDLAQIESRWGTMLARVDITEAQQPGSLFLPMHWTRQYSSLGRVGAVVNAVVDPLSGQPESKQTPVRIDRWPAKWQALVLSRQPLTLPACGYWVKSKGDHYWRYDLADQSALDHLPGWSRKLLGPVADTCDWLEYRDSHRGDYRCAHITDRQLQSCLFMTANGRLPEPAWLCGLFAKAALTREERLSLLSGLPPQGQEDAGRTICSCFNVSEKTILKAVKTQGLQSVSAIGQCLKAGTGCGSCQPELKQIIKNSKL